MRHLFNVTCKNSENVFNLLLSQYLTASAAHVQCINTAPL